MTQKKFSQMPTKKLQALLATASDEDRVKIQAIIDKRNAVSTPAVVEASLSEEEQEAVDAATSDSTAKPKPSRKKAPQLTNEQRTALAESMRAEALHHKCEVVPFNTCEWVPGVVVGVIEEKRNNKCLYAIKTEDGRRVVKAYGSDLVKILDEVVEPVKKERKSRVKLDENGNPIPSAAKEPLGEWLPEEIEVAINEVIANVGKTITYPKAGAMGVKLEGEESGRIVSLVPNKRQHTILYRIEVDQEDSEAPKKYAHKVTSNEDLKIADELDEVGAKINEAFVKRHNGEHKPRIAKTPAEALEYAKVMLEKAKEQLKKAEINVGKRNEAYKLAQEMFEKSQQNSETENTEAENTEVSTEDDLM